MTANTAQARERAYEAALAQVLLRITGTRDALAPDLIKEWFPNPSRYVLQYRPGEENSLWVTLDGTAIERVLREAGQNVWSGQRPLTLVWLAVDWGQGEREIIGADDPDRSLAEVRSIERNRLLRERVQEVALARGIPVTFPLLDAEELQSVSFSDIWGGFSDRLLEASARYGASSVLVGRVRPDTLQRDRWSWYFSDERREWSGEAEEVVNLLADSLAARLSVSGGTPLESIVLTVTGIASLEAYGAVHSFMQDLDLVEDVVIDQVSGDRIRYRVTTLGGQERLRRALESSRILEPADRFGGPATRDGLSPPSALEFRYRP